MVLTAVYGGSRYTGDAEAGDVSLERVRHKRQFQPMALVTLANRSGDTPACNPAGPQPRRVTAEDGAKP
jgi:hypothetical protein